jgi:perosamine synthetase
MRHSTVRGTDTLALESGFSAFVDGRHCVAVRSERAALQLAFQALGVGVGDEVVVPSFAPERIATTVLLTGGTPVFADIDPLTLCVTPATVGAVLSPRTAAIVPVHTFGYCAPVDALADLAAGHGVALVEDAGQALSAARAGRRAGTVGTLSVLGTGLQGGAVAVATGDVQLALTLRLLRDQDPAGTLPSREPVAATRKELDRLVGATARRRANARFLDSALTGVLVPHVEPEVHHVYASYTVRVPGNGRPDRDAFARALAVRGVRATLAVPTPVHRLPEHRARVQLPHTETATGQTLSLPVDDRLTEREMRRTAAACNSLGGLL